MVSTPDRGVIETFSTAVLNLVMKISLLDELIDTFLHSKEKKYIDRDNSIYEEVNYERTEIIPQLLCGMVDLYLEAKYENEKKNLLANMRTLSSQYSDLLIKSSLQRYTLHGNPDLWGTPLSYAAFSGAHEALSVFLETTPAALNAVAYEGERIHEFTAVSIATKFAQEPSSSMDNYKQCLQVLHDHNVRLPEAALALLNITADESNVERVAPHELAPSSQTARSLFPGLTFHARKPVLAAMRAEREAENSVVDNLNDERPQSPAI